MKIYNSSMNIATIKEYHRRFPNRKLNVLRSLGMPDAEVDDICTKYRHRLDGLILDSGDPACDAGGEIYEMDDLGLGGSRISESNEKGTIYELTEQEAGDAIEGSINDENEPENRDTQESGVSVLC